MEITGRIIKVLDAVGGTSQATGQPWKKQEYVLETVYEQFPRKICFNIWGEDKINLMNIQEGEVMTVFFDINAREYNGRWFNDIRAYRVDRNVNAQPQTAQPYPGAPAQQQAPVQPTQQQAAPTPPPFSGGNDTDDLPF